MEIKTTEEIRESVDYMFQLMRKEIPEDRIVLDKKWVAVDDMIEEINKVYAYVDCRLKDLLYFQKQLIDKLNG